MLERKKLLWPFESCFPFVLIILLIFSNSVDSMQQKKVLNLQTFQWEKETATSSCHSPKLRWEQGVAILEIKDRDYCSAEAFDWDKKLQRRLITDNFRVLSLHSRINSAVSGKINDAMGSQIPLGSGVLLQTLNYIVTVELGGKNMTVIVDTGSDLTWVQCQPCKMCYSQRDPIFNPSLSRSYQAVLCNSSTCQYLAYATGNSGVCGGNPPTCNYVVSYGDGSYTRGDLAMEYLSLGNTKLKKFIFGCGRNNKGLFGGASGLLGLGRSDISLVSQTSGIFGEVFSYCLPSTAPKASGSLILGRNISVYKNTTPVSYTRMIPNPQLPTFYFLNLTGISVGGVFVQSPSFGASGILIDSGTVISRLPPSIYKALNAEFLKQFSGFPPAPSFSILDTCFNLSRYTEVEIPTIKMHFEGKAELDVDVTGIFYFVKADASHVCLALASLTYEDEIGIIGNYQQRNQRVIYDGKLSQLGLAKEDCSFKEAK